MTSNKIRVNDILLGQIERSALNWMLPRIPAWVTPDMLTMVGIMGALIIGISYCLSSVNANFLWLASLGLAVNWFGDSLDGNLARYRHIERSQYGFFIDHSVDAFNSVILCVGLGLSSFVSLPYALLVLVGYLLMFVHVLVFANVHNVFKISYNKLGSTEVRVLILFVNALFYFLQLNLLIYCKL